MSLRIRRLETGLILMSAIHAMPSTGHYPLDPPALFADMPYSQPMPPHRHARDASIRPSKKTGGLVDRSGAALWLHPTRAMFQVPGNVSTRRAECMSAT
ncbi:hypothetical protein COCC4DRAFT_130438 [Bipolaris maydis ATCC 48331]|uniref:Uncharacterized protein n=2 Tax=Cochliobolus heterostrophus TaxID=5016 RepID=M2U1L8_COCH5|nr:uncharacterized protein COCC4DRAFT_130438 [Bipolaris maydis ATCC 48331]EMD92454.1 hypothetical protein COCHEDRAFT_1155428 [Bipolaris maydis C5]ENI08148.1 hypothetical protein COCC4DRAFT_130438 [Bipolaris maydis ATCC 48331]